MSAFDSKLAPVVSVPGKAMRTWGSLRLGHHEVLQMGLDVPVRVALHSMGKVTFWRFVSGRGPTALFVEEG